MRLALLGSPVSQSASPAFQQAALDAAGIAGRYEAREVDADGMRAAADAVRAGTLDGANITAPWKALAAELADRRSDVVELLGAANTWVRDADGAVRAENTDPVGVIALCRAFAPATLGHVVVLGAGGAARAAAWALSRHAERVTVVARRRRDAEEVCADLVVSPLAGDAALGAGRWPTSAWSRRELGRATADAHVVVNATSARGDAATQAFALLPWWWWRDTVALDLSYARTPTAFVEAAAARRLAAHDGAVMLLAQGAASFRAWTGQRAPIGPMREALAATLGRDVAALGG
jgi:shikimate dehydrogenase